MEKRQSNGRSILAHVVLIILSFLCLFFFYILIVNATRSHAQLQLGFSALPGSSFLTNFKNVINDPAIPILKGIQNSLIVSGCCAAIVPIIIIYLLLSKFIVEGVTLGGVRE